MTCDCERGIDCGWVGRGRAALGVSRSCQAGLKLDGGARLGVAAAVRAPTIDMGLAAGDRPRTPFSTAPVAALAIDVARLRIGLSTAEGEAEPPRSLLPGPCLERGTSSCLIAPARGGVETGLLCMPSDSAVAEMRLNRCGVAAAGGVLDKFEFIEELLERRLGPLATREDEDEDDGGVLRLAVMEERVGVPSPRPEWEHPFVRSLDGIVGKLATEVAGLAASWNTDESLLSERTRRKRASILLRSLSVLASSSRRVRQRERRSERRRRMVPFTVCLSLQPFSRL